MNGFTPLRSMPGSRCTLRRSTATTITVYPSRASRGWRGRCGRPLRSTRAARIRCPRPRARSADTIEFRTMPAYAVFEPPMRGRSAGEQADRFIFLRERFSLAAFLFGPLWMIWRRLWLVLIIYLVATSLIELGLRSLGIPIAARTAVYLLLQLLVAIEAANLRRWTLVRRGWRDRGIVFGDDLELAERRFFAANAARRDAAN